MAIHKKHISTILLGLLLGGLIGTSVYFYYQYKGLQEQKSAPQVSNEAADLYASVSALMTLPPGETPAIATVTDKTKLTNQPVLVNAENGDKLLVFGTAGTIIVYRPFTGKIINVAPLSQIVRPANTEPAISEAPVPTTAPLVMGAATSAAALVTPTPLVKSAKLAIYNGSKTAGLSNVVETMLTNAKVAGVEVITKEMASKNTYTKNQISDVTGTNTDTVAKIATLIGADIVPLPVDEAKPLSADILIIAGK